jgi:serine/threonine protein kinase/Tfp pilus assembly protein PilF
MTQLVAPSRMVALDDFVRAFEAARGDDADAPLESFLPAPDHPLYARVVCELVRVEMEHDWDRGRPRALDRYCGAFPEVFANPAALGEIALEEYRLRREHGEDPSPEEYAGRYDVATDGWPTGPAEPSEVADAADELLADSLAHRRYRAENPTDDAPKFISPKAKTALVGDAIELFKAVREVNPAAADRLAVATVNMPGVGDQFLGFSLIDELGRGAFGRVFLARQAELSDRPVALKITADLRGEPQTLARMQHTNIVPVHSVHRSGAFHAVCMPYFGATTLGDVIESLRPDDALPKSGRHIVTTLNGRKSRTRELHSQAPANGPSDNHASLRRERSEASALPSEDALAAVRSPRGETVNPLLSKLEGLSYVQAVLWVGARLADGLAHAHERGVLHRDLKPANVLITDDGQPMLLDFNLAADTRPLSAVTATMGGTLPYMAPEQLEAFQGVKRPVDQRSDIYALGLMLFELLTGKAAFPGKTRPLHSELSRMISDRRKLPPYMCPLNPAVTPAVESIVHRCLSPDPAHRYQSASELEEDLERQLADRPLRYAREPSLRERARKWARRHPRLSSSTAVGIAALVALATVATGTWTVKKRLDMADAAGLQGKTHKTMDTLLALQNSPENAALRNVIDLSSGALAKYQLPDNPRWQSLPAVTNLEPEQRVALRRDVSEVLLVWADAERTIAESETDGGRRAERLSRAWDLNATAEACLGSDRQSRAVWQQRAHLAGLLGRPDADSLREEAARLQPATADEHVHVAREYLFQREFRKAIPYLADATHLDPQHFWAWYFLGNCYSEMRQFPEAISCYSACLAASPDPSVVYFAYYQRAMAYLKRGRNTEAAVDLAEAVRTLGDLPPELRQDEEPKAHLLRAELATRKKDYAAAEESLTAALKLGALETRILHERARVRDLRKDAAGARRDRDEILRREPADEHDWNIRGLVRLPADPRAALADFEQALAIDPRYYPALQNKAHVLSERLDQPREALAALDRVIELYPGYTQGRIGRAVLLARQGKRAEAHADVRDSLARDHNAMTLYQAANVYALTSRQEPKDRERVIPLLAVALWGGFGLDEVDHDADFEAVRQLLELSKLVEIVREFQRDDHRDR